MMPQTFLALALAARALLPGDTRVADNNLPQPEQEAQTLAVQYQPDTREVSNWRREAMDALEPKPVVVLAASSLRMVPRFLVNRDCWRCRIPASFSISPLTSIAMIFDVSVGVVGQCAPIGE